MFPLGIVDIHRRLPGDRLVTGLGSENLRMLNFFHGRTIAVVSHGFSKERKIPPGEIKVAKARMDAFKAEPERHTFRPPADEE